MPFPSNGKLNLENTFLPNGVRDEIENDQPLIKSTMAELSIKEKDALEKLKNRVANDVPSHLKNNVYLYLHFLRAKNFNLNAAEDMLRKHLEWRKMNQIDKILTDFVPPEVASKYIPLTRIGFDKEGAPVRYFAFGDMDSKGILKCIKQNDCLKTIFQCLEEDVSCMKKQSKKMGKLVDQWTYIFDMKNYSFAKVTHKPTLEAVISLFMQYEANYPERLKAAYIINASLTFTILFSVIKPLLSGATIKKVVIFGKDGWKEELQKSINPDVLPVFLGGKKLDYDGDPMCKSFIKHGQLVPEECYLNKSTNRLSSQTGVSKINVTRQSKFKLKLDVDEPGSLIEWEFETTGKDIGFGLFFKDPTTDDSIKELIPTQRIDTQLVSEVGMYHCEVPGSYILVFDNSYSWILQKDVYYKVSVVNPKAENFQVS